MLYRTKDDTKWGAGVGVDLTATQIDGNFWELRSALNNLIANPGVPVSIASITTTGSKLTFNMSDGSTIGPVFMPVFLPKWRGVWLPGISYTEFDWFQVPGVGLYFVLNPHISPAVFDPLFLAVDGNPAYLLLFAFAVPKNLIYDIGFGFPGKLSYLTSDVVYLYQEPVARKILLPVVPFVGSAHQAYLQTASTGAQTFDIYQNDVVIGTVVFASGVNVGVITISADTTFEIGDRLALGKALTVDATAAGLSVTFAAQQVV